MQSGQRFWRMLSASLIAISAICIILTPYEVSERWSLIWLQTQMQSDQFTDQLCLSQVFSNFFKWKLRSRELELTRVDKINGPDHQILSLITYTKKTPKTAMMTYSKRLDFSNLVCVFIHTCTLYMHAAKALASMQCPVPAFVSWQREECQNLQSCIIFFFIFFLPYAC